MVTSWTSQTRLPCEDICWKASELSANPSGLVMQPLTDSSQWFSSGLIKKVPLTWFWFLPLTPITPVFSPGHSLRWNLCLYLEWVSKVTIHHLLYRFAFWSFVWKYDYRACTLRIQNYNPCKYCTGFSQFFFCDSILLLNGSFHVWFINLEKKSIFSE